MEPPFGSRIIRGVCGATERIGNLGRGAHGPKRGNWRLNGLIVGVDAVSLGLVQPPGHWGADIVVGEGQPFGIGPTGGGPIYGIFACTQEFLRLMPGRIVGQSIDTEGETAYTLTLSTREQHIRRHRATSNICSNETLIALMGAMHMSLLGPEGLEKLATRISSSTYAVMEAVTKIPGVELVNPGGPSSGSLQSDFRAPPRTHSPAWTHQGFSEGSIWAIGGKKCQIAC